MEYLLIMEEITLYFREIMVFLKIFNILIIYIKKKNKQIIKKSLINKYILFIIDFNCLFLKKIVNKDIEKAKN